MEKIVEFLVPGSPNAAFLSQIAALDLSIRSASWTDWTPRVRAVLGGEIDRAAVSSWQERLPHVDFLFVAMTKFQSEGYFAQIDARLEMASRQAEIVALVDADIFLCREIEAALDDVKAKAAVGGVIAHYGFPWQGGHSTAGTWAELARQLIARPIALDFSHTLLDPSEPMETRACPFYVNAGIVLISRSVIDNFYERYRKLRSRVLKMIPNQYFSGQIAVALAVADLELPTTSLPMSYNFPNDVIADRLHSSELPKIRIIHYLRSTNFDRSDIFASEDKFAHFLNMNLAGSNAIFQSHVRRVCGGAYPFN